jgi:hypothetical protein
VSSCRHEKSFLLRSLQKYRKTMCQVSGMSKRLTISVLLPDTCRA